MNGIEGGEIHPVDVHRRYGESAVLPGKDRVHISKVVLPGQLVSHIFEDVRTKVDLMERGCRESENGRCLGWRSTDSEYSWLTYKEVLTRAKNFGSGLLSLGLTLGQSTFIGIYSRNCPEWVIAEQGCYSYSSPVIPLHESLGSDALKYMINKGDVKLVVCDTPTKVKSLLKTIDETPSLKHIVCIDKVDEDLRKSAKRNGVSLFSFEMIEVIGKLKPIPGRLPTPDDIAFVCFTSGTTGNPKGALITHGNVIASASGLMLQMGPLALNKNSVMISYLPLAHIMEQILEVLVYMVGGCVGFFRNDISRLLEDMEILQPTFFPAVPRLLNKLYDKVQAQIKRSKLITEVDTETEKSEKKISKPNVDQTIRQSFMKSLGGRIQLILTAAAPVSENVLTFYLQTLGCNVVEAYGQTECAGPCTFNVVSETSKGNVGVPIPCCMVKLVEDPDLEYKGDHNVGEVCIKGNNVTKGYLKDPEKTAESIDEDGWLHTGDIGMWLPNGKLKIIDRKKHIFKLSQGEFVAPEKLENVYLQSRFISQILVYGESLKSFLVAIVVPDEEVVSSWCKENSKCSKWVEICQDPDIEKIILDDMKAVAKSAGLLHYEQVKKIHLHPKLMTIEDGHLTPTFKTKRETCRKYFAKEIQEMYGNSEF